MKLSVIIPVYNVEAYLPACLDSVLSQGVEDSELEVVCVNDGSPDGSADIVRQYMAKHGNIVLVEQENKGVSVARNNGMAHASGEFILFADADDRFAEGSLKRLLDGVDGGVDLTICNSIRNGIYAFDWHRSFKENTVYTSEEILNGGFLYGAVWGVCFRMDFLACHNIRFLQGVRNSEDTIFVLHSLYCTNRTRFLDVDLYEVNNRDGSASRVFSKKRIDIMIESVKKVSDFRNGLLGGKGNRMVLDYMMYTMFLNLVKDTTRTPGLGYRYLRSAGVERYAKFDLSPASRFLRSKMQLLRTSFAAFYFVRKLYCLTRGGVPWSFVP